MKNYHFIACKWQIRIINGGMIRGHVKIEFRYTPYEQFFYNEIVHNFTFIRNFVKFC